MTTGIYDPSSESHEFYKTLLKWLDINTIMHGMGHSKLIRDMTTEEYLEYEQYMKEYVKVGEK
jgi:hypothetical protein